MDDRGGNVVVLPVTPVRPTTGERLLVEVGEQHDRIEELVRDRYDLTEQRDQLQQQLDGLKRRDRGMKITLLTTALGGISLAAYGYYKRDLTMIMSGLGIAEAVLPLGCMVNLVYNGRLIT